MFYCEGEQRMERGQETNHTLSVGAEQSRQKEQWVQRSHGEVCLAGSVMGRGQFG